MVSRERVEAQLKRIGCNFRFWGRSELRELGNILMDSEVIAHCVNGHYNGGFAMLCATDHRVLLVDKKPMNYLNVEDVRFEMISEFDYSHRLMNATVRICGPMKTLTFTSWNQHRLRTLLSYVQQRVIEIRQYYYLAHQFQAMQPQPQSTTPAYVPNLAMEAAGGAQPSNPMAQLGAYTYSKLPRLRRREGPETKHLGEYAVNPDDIFPPNSSNRS